MHPNLAAQLVALQQSSVCALRTRYAELFGEPTTCRHKAWLVKRLAWRLQALAEGDLSERARLRAEQLANDADLRLAAPRPPKNGNDALPAQSTVPATRSGSADPRLPPPGNLPLGETGQAMNCPELIEAMKAKGYWTSPAGKTPAATLYAAIAREIKLKADQARFQKAEPGRFRHA
jgi:hypothetical protein